MTSASVFMFMLVEYQSMLRAAYALATTSADLTAGAGDGGRGSRSLMECTMQGI